MNRRLAPAVVLLLAFPAWVALADSATASHDLNVKLGRLYVEQAAAAAQSSEWATAAELISTALEYDPSSSDAYYEQGMIQEQSGGSVEPSITSYQKALAVDAWSGAGAADCRLRLARLLYRTHRFGDALDALGPVLSIGGADALLLDAECLAASGRNQAARVSVEQAMQSYPQDFRFVDLRLRIDPSFRDALSRRFISGSDVWFYPSTVLAELITDSTDASLKRQLVAKYGELFGASPAVFAQSLLAAAAVSKSDLDRFVAEGGFANGRVAEQLYAALPDASSREYLASKVAGFSGSSTLDADRDGYPEERADYSSGSLSRLFVDENQDGAPDLDVEFSKGLPSAALVARGGNDYQLTYGEYPYVDRVEYVHDGIRTAYLMAPGRFVLPVFAAGTSVPGARIGLGAGGTATNAPPARLLFPTLAASAASLDPKALFAAASSVDEIDVATNKPYAMWNRSIDDLLKMVSEWQNGGYRYEVTYQNGEKSVARRDIDDDGKFEVTESYDHGKLTKVAYDGNHDGKPEFWIDLSGTPTLNWDFNEDGVIDAREQKVSATRTLLYLSSKLDGTFDIVIDEATK